MSVGRSARRNVLKRVRRVVVKVGSGVLAGSGGRLSRKAIERVVREIASAKARGLEVVLVSSGAIAAGLGELAILRRPTVMARLQAAAAVGQCVLMQEYFHAFKKLGLHCAQILLTNEDLRHRARYLNIRHTLMTLIAQGVVPVINENDTVGTDEIRFGDNDRLSALVSRLWGADLLVVLSDVGGLLRAVGQGGMARISVVRSVNHEIESHAWSGSSALGTGGMKTKLQAARMVTQAGQAMVIAHGKTAGILKRILDGGDEGTLFLAKSGRPKRKRSV